jgi:hypothetical protein
VAAVLLVLLSLLHSYLGEKYILVRLFRLDHLPKIFGSDDFTKRTLRFAWHLTTIAWLGIAALMVYIAQPNINRVVLGNIIGLIFFLHFLVAFIGSKAKHLSWIIFILITLLVTCATNL